MNKAQWQAFAESHNERDAELLMRTYDTLMGNVYGAEGYPWSPYRCITPGKNHFTGIWNWDSAFHAMGVCRWDLKLAQESILGFLQFQLDRGLIPDVIWENGIITDYYTKPPVFPQAVEVLHRQEKDFDFLQKVYPMLVKNEAFWVRDRSDNGLFFYDAEIKGHENYELCVRYESGWDNSVRWDNGITNLWPIDLNCFMVLFYRSMAYLAEELGLAEDAALWKAKEAALAEKVNRHLWDEAHHRYADADRFTGAFSAVLSPASFMPLYACIASRAQAEAMNVIAENDFRKKMPTVAFDDPGYSNDYWRGPTWLNTAYFAAKGLKNYGFPVADRIKENILDMCYAEKDGIFENYDSLTGKGLCCDHFSWSSVFINEFILNFQGVPRLEKFKLLHSTIEIGLEKPFKILHLTDTHFHYDDEGNDHWRKRDFNHEYEGCCVEYFNNAINYAAENDLLVLHTGDIWDFMSEGNFRAAKEAFDRIDCIFATGNHELYCDVDEHYHVNVAKPEQIAHLLPNDLNFYSRVVNGVNFVTLDNSHYQITEDQLSRLKAEAEKGLPIILGVHTPLYVPSLADYMMGVYRNAGVLAAPEALVATYPRHVQNLQAANEATRQAAEYICSEPAIKAVIAGHTHCNHEGEIAPGKPQIVTHGTYHGYAREITIV